MSLKRYANYFFYKRYYYVKVIFVNFFLQLSLDKSVLKTFKPQFCVDLNMLSINRVFVKIFID